MEVHESNGFRQLFQEECETNLEELFPLAQKCIIYSTDEKEVLKALEITFEFGLSVFSLDDLEIGILQQVGPVSKKIFFRQIENLESNKLNEDFEDPTSEYSNFLSVCFEILSYLNNFFNQLNKFQDIKILQVESLLINSVEILYASFCHCNISEQVYGPNFSSVTQHLTSFFKKSCELLEQLLNLLTNKLTCTNEERREIAVLCDVFKSLSKSAFVLMNLDVKMMAKVWKILVSLIEKYFHYIKESFNVSDIINYLSKTISSSTESVLRKENDQELTRTIKLACFNLKLIIKFCDIFQNFITECEESLINLLLTLCWCNIVPLNREKDEATVSNDVLKQLSFGTDPLLLHLIKDENIINEFSMRSKNLDHKSNEQISFAVLSCLVLKKLVHCDKCTRKLWMNSKVNILSWIFYCFSIEQYNICANMQISHFLVEGKQKRTPDLYEYILAITSAFVITSRSDEFQLIERTLIENVLQPEPLPALLAIDIWCILARFSDSDLCLTQIFKLGKIFKEFQYDTMRAEKCYLMSLIQRMFPLLTNSQKEVFTKSFQLPFMSDQWKIHRLCSENQDFDLYLMHHVSNSFVCQLEKYIFRNNAYTSISIDSDFSNCEENTLRKIFEKLIFQLWKFNSTSIFPYALKINYFKMACLMTVDALPYISSETIHMVASKIKKFSSDPCPSIQLYITWILTSLSLVTFPPDTFQKTIIEEISNIFATLLSSENVLVKQKTLEVFYNFSHVTSHAEIVALSVNGCVSLKSEVTNYFKKIICYESNRDIHVYCSKLCQASLSHSCNEALDEPSVRQNVLKNGDEICERWKKDGEVLVKMINELTSLQKKEIRGMCTLLLNDLQ